MADASLLLLANNRIGCLTYEPETGQAEFIETDYSVNGIQRFSLFLATVSRKAAGAAILVKPTDQATLGNICDIINVLRCNRIRFNLSTQFRQTDSYLLQQYSWIRGKRVTLPFLKKMQLRAEWYKGG